MLTHIISESEAIEYDRNGASFMNKRALSCLARSNDVANKSTKPGRCVDMQWRCACDGLGNTSSGDVIRGDRICPVILTQLFKLGVLCLLEKQARQHDVAGQHSHSGTGCPRINMIQNTE